MTAICANQHSQTSKTMNETLLTTMQRPAGTSATATPERFPDYVIYKPNNRGNGGAVRFTLNRTKAAAFVEAANQSGERQFDWERKIIMKWSPADVGAVLAGLQGKVPQTKLFHRTEKANSACLLNAGDSPDKAPFLLAISRQENNGEDDKPGKDVRKVAIPLTCAEVAVLETALRTAIIRILGW